MQDNNAGGSCQNVMMFHATMSSTQKKRRSRRKRKKCLSESLKRGRVVRVGLVMIINLEEDNIYGEEFSQVMMRLAI